MKKIILIRHAKVDIDNTQKISANLMRQWVKEYDMAELCRESKPGQETIEAVENTDVVVTSALKRAIDSANVLGTDIYERNALFNEAAIPDVHIAFLKLKPKTWLVILRVLLLFGLGKKDASLKASKLQAGKAAKRLLELVDIDGSVILVGHGGMNWLIRKSLMKEGWVLEEGASNSNWGMTVITLKDTKA